MALDAKQTLLHGTNFSLHEKSLRLCLLHSFIIFTLMLSSAGSVLAARHFTSSWRDPSTLVMVTFSEDGKKTHVIISAFKARPNTGFCWNRWTNMNNRTCASCQFNLSKGLTTVQNWGDHANCPGKFSNTKQSKEHRIHWECHGIQDGDFNQRSCANGHINIIGTNPPKLESQDTYANKYIQDKKDGKHHIANFDDELPSRHCLQCRAVAWL